MSIPSSPLRKSGAHNTFEQTPVEATPNTTSQAGTRSQHKTHTSPLSHNPSHRQSSHLESQRGRRQAGPGGRLQASSQEPVGFGTGKVKQRVRELEQVLEQELELEERGVVGGTPAEAERTAQTDAGDLLEHTTSPNTTPRSRSLVSEASVQSMEALLDHIATPAANLETLGAGFVAVDKAARDARLKFVSLMQAQALRGKDEPPDPDDLTAIEDAAQQMIETNRVALHQGIRALSVATKYPNTPMTPEAGNVLWTFAGQMVGALGFITAASLTAIRPDKASEIFFPLMGLTVPLAKEAQAWATRKMGGGSFETMMRAGHSSFPGPFKKVAADFSMLTNSLLLYVGTSALFALPPHIGSFSQEHPAGPLTRAVASSALSGAGVLSLQVALAKRTLGKNGAERTEDLPITRHNRSLVGALRLPAVGKLLPGMDVAAVMQALPKWNDRTTGEFKIKELGISLAVSLLSAGFGYGVAHGIGDATAPHDPKESFQQGRSLVAVIGLGVMTYFVASLVLQLAVTKWRNNPAAHAHHPFGQAESEVMARQISKSAFSIAERYLDELGRDLEGGKLGPRQQARFEAATTVLSGEARRTGDHDAMDALARQLTTAARLASLSRDVQIEEGGVEADSTSRRTDDSGGKVAGERPHDGAMLKIEEWARRAAKSLQVLRDTDSGTQVQFAMNDATQRLRDIQFLILECHYQSQGTQKPEGPAASESEHGLAIKVDPSDGRVNRVARALLPAFAALRKCDRYEAAKGFAEAMENYDKGALTAQEAVQLVSTPNAHKRVLMKNIADLVIQTGQDRALFLKVFDRMVVDAGHGSTPFTQAKAALLHNALNREALSTDEVQAADAKAETEIAAVFEGLRSAGDANPKPNSGVGGTTTILPLAGGSTATPGQTRRGLADRLMSDLKDGSLSTEILQDALHERQVLMESDAEVRAEAAKATAAAGAAERVSIRAAGAAASAVTAADNAEAAIRNAAAAPPGREAGAGIPSPETARRLRDVADEATEGARQAAEDKDKADEKRRLADAELAKVVSATGELKAFEAAMGDGFREALTQEVRNGLVGDDPLQMKNAAAQFIGTMLDDVEAMDDANKVPIKVAMSIPHSTQKAELTPRVYTDTHAHPTGYSGNVTSLLGLGNYMDSAAVLMSVMAGIPSQVWGFTAKAKYYANALYKTALDYRSHDDQLANDYKALPADLQKRIILSITGLDLTNPASMEKVLDQRMRDHPGVFRGVGEVTWMKEIVSKMQVHIPQKRAVVLLMKLCAMRGLPVLLHCDRGEPGDKNKFEASVIEALDEANKSVDEWRTQDKLAQKLGLENVPPPKSTVIWAHGGGKSRFTPEADDHTERMDDLLTKNKNLKWDASWDFVNNDMLQNLYDQLGARNVAPKMRQGLQDVIKAYEAFAALGGRSDKADDLGDKNQSAALRVAAEKATDLYFHALEDFKHIAKEEFKDKKVVDAFANMASEHGNKGNNWFYLAAKHPESGMFGTDSLQVGMKAHGDAAYAMNAKVMEPMMVLFDELAEKRPDIAGVQGLSHKICVQNFKDTWLDEDMAARRAAHEQSLQDEQPTDWATRQPTRWTSEETPIEQDMIDDLPSPSTTAARQPLTKKETRKSDSGEEAFKFGKQPPPASLRPRPEPPGQRLGRAQEQREAGIDILATGEAVGLVESRRFGAADEEAMGSLSGAVGGKHSVITAKPADTSDPRAIKASGEWSEAVAGAMPAARKFLADNGAVVVKNSGSGLNCLIISLLQHAASAYTPELQKEENIEATAEALRKELKLGHDMLYSDDHGFRRLVDRVNTLYPDARLNVTVAQPSADGKFATFSHKPDPKNTNAVLILQGVDHYEAVTMAVRDTKA